MDLMLSKHWYNKRTSAIYADELQNWWRYLLFKPNSNYQKIYRTLDLTQNKWCRPDNSSSAATLKNEWSRFFCKPDRKYQFVHANKDLYPISIVTNQKAVFWIAICQLLSYMSILFWHSNITWCCFYSNLSFQCQMKCRMVLTGQKAYW